MTFAPERRAAGRSFAAGAAGRSFAAGAAGEIPLIAVHGFQFDPKSRRADNPHARLFPLWEQLFEGRTLIRWGWYSVPQSWKTVLGAWARGYRNRYTWAWELAEHEAAALAVQLAGAAGQVDVVCHSLGSRVVVEALRRFRAQSNVRRVLILNGAEYSASGRQVAELHPDTLFFNAVTSADDVLNKLGRFAPGIGGDFLGNAGMPPDALLPNWYDIRLDRPEWRAWADTTGGWKVEGDNPRSIGDHWHTYEHGPNWGLWRWLMGGRMSRDALARVKEGGRVE